MPKQPVSWSDAANLLLCIGVVGLNDVFLVETDDAILVCAKSRAQEVKEVVERLKRKKRYDLI